MRILGIDPGIERVGFGVIEIKNRLPQVLDFGCIKTKKELSHGTRLSQIKKDLKKLIDTWKPDFAAVEKLFFSKNIKTGIAVAESRGVIIQTLEENNISTSEYTPNEVKSSVCGDGNAQKAGIQKMVKLILRLNIIPKPDDAADALGLALCMAQHISLENFARKS